MFIENKKYCLGNILADGTKIFTPLLFNRKQDLKIDFNQEGSCDVTVTKGEPMLFKSKLDENGRLSLDYDIKGNRIVTLVLQNGESEQIEVEVHTTDHNYFP